MKLFVVCTAAAGLACFWAGFRQLGERRSQQTPETTGALCARRGFHRGSPSPVLEVDVSDPDRIRLPSSSLEGRRGSRRTRRSRSSTSRILRTTRHRSTSRLRRPSALRRAGSSIISIRSISRSSFTPAMSSSGATCTTLTGQRVVRDEDPRGPRRHGRPYGVPYSVALGNHDRPGAGYERIFGASHFEGRPYYGGQSGLDNKNHFSLFTASGLTSSC